MRKSCPQSLVPNPSPGEKQSHSARTRWCSIYLGWCFPFLLLFHLSSSLHGIFHWFAILQHKIRHKTYISHQKKSINKKIIITIIITHISKGKKTGEGSYNCFKFEEDHEFIGHSNCYWLALHNNYAKRSRQNKRKKKITQKRWLDWTSIIKKHQQLFLKTQNFPFHSVIPTKRKIKTPRTTHTPVLIPKNTFTKKKNTKQNKNLKKITITNLLLFGHLSNRTA